MAGMLIAYRQTVRETCSRQPLLLGAVSFLIGIAWGYRARLWVLAVVGVFLCGCFIWWLSVVRSHRRTMFCVGLLFFFGWFLSARDVAGRSHEAEKFLEVVTRRSYVCRVGSDVQIKPLRGKAAQYRFSGESFQSADGRARAHFLPVDVTWYGAKECEGVFVPHAGEVWRLSGKASLVQGRDGLTRLRLNTGESRSERLVAADSSSWLARVSHARRLATARVALGIESWGDVPALNQAILLGHRQTLSPALRRIFVNSGTIHVFAISGLHIVLVAAVLSLVISTLGVPRPYWVIALAPPLIFYTVITGARPSAVRACLMTLLYFTGPLFSRKPSGVAALAGTVLLVYGAQPWLLYDVGCTLSFVVMAGLITLCPPFCQIGQRFSHCDVFTQRAVLFEAAGSMYRAKGLKMAGTLLRGLTDALAVSVAAWLSSIPLTAHYFGRVTPGGVFANLIVGPCAFVIVVAGCLGMIASLVSDWVASCFNHAAGLFTQMMVVTARWVSTIPGANLRVTKWPVWLVWLWFGLLLLLSLWLHTRRKEQGQGLAWLKKNDPEH